MYGKSANVNLNESSVDKGMIIEYPEFMDVSENSSAANIETPIAIINTNFINNTQLNNKPENNTNANASVVTNTFINTSTTINSNSNTNITSITNANETTAAIPDQPIVEINSSNQASLPETPTKAIRQQTETRRADGRRRITPMFIPLNEK